MRSAALLSERHLHVDETAERSPDPDRAGHADGQLLSLLLVAGSDDAGIAGERMSSRSRQAALRASLGVPRQRGPLRPYRRVLRAPKNRACAARITAGSMTSQASALMFRRSRSRVASAKKSNSRAIR